jgi:hypothetical protein
MPDLFSALPQANAPARRAALRVKAKPDNRVLARHLLSKDLAGALKHLNDAELDALLAAVTTEAKRRGLLRPSPTKQSQPCKAGDGLGSLTSGQLNAVHAAFKAGVKPSVIARQFRLSQSDVRKALAAEGRKSKSR